MKRDLSPEQLQRLHAVLRSAAERAESERRVMDAAKLAEEIAVLEHELEGSAAE